MNTSFAIGSGELSNKIAFLKNGEVWVSDVGKGQPKQITSDSGKVVDFQFSPSLKYLAYTKIIGYEEEEEWDNESNSSVGKHSVAVHSIRIMEPASQKVISTIMPTENRARLEISTWLSDDKLRYFGSLSEFDAEACTYDIQKGITKEDDYNSTMLAARGNEFSADGSLKIYTDRLNNIHLVDSRTKTDKIIFSKKSFMTSHAISSDNKLVAIEEHEKIEKKNYYNLWVYDIKQGILKQLYSKEDRVWGRISWSFDSRLIGIFSPLKALVIEVDNPKNLRLIKGIDFSWVGNNEIVYHHWHDNNLHGVYLYNIASGESNLLFDGAQKPIFLRE
jgi:hypothetical protein